MPNKRKPKPEAALPDDVDVLVISAVDDLDDLVWKELCRVFSVSKSSVCNYARGSTEVLADLRAHKIHQEDVDRYWRLHPRLRSSSGVLLTGCYGIEEVAGKKVCVFCSDLRLNTDGPTAPVMRLLPQLVRETTPRLVLYVGLGGAVRADQQAGDVVVTSSASFGLRGELASAPFNGAKGRSKWKPDRAWFEDLSFESLQEPELLAPSPHYQASDEVRPPEHAPIMRLEALPVMTRPLLTEATFDIPSPTVGDRDYWGDSASAIDMDAAPVGDACGETQPYGFVIGLAMPAILRFPYDHEESLRKAWADHMVKLFAADAARNAVEVAMRIVKNGP